MTGNGYERNRVLGFPVRPGRHPGQREEQHVMGFPASWFDDVNVDALARLVRGRALSRPLPDGPVPAFGVYLLGRRPPAVPWESRWLKWPDFRLPSDAADVLPALTEAWQRAVAERVEIACAGGHGRTGTALACLAILDGVPGTEAVAFVREHYDPHAVETPGQRRYVARWSAPC